MDLLGRRAEREAIEQLLSLARRGRSGALLVRGEAGIGKSALLEHARDVAEPSGFRVESSTGVEHEAQFAFAGLHQLCARLLHRLGALPDPQQTALGVAFGQHGGAPPERFLVGLATLNLLAEAAEEGPLLCLVDDVQWLDEASAQVLAFVARRVEAERLALLLAWRDVDEVHPFAGLPEVRLEGLGQTHARTLLTTAVRTRLDVGVRDRIVAEARGNPLALLELPRGVQPAQLAGGFELPDVLSVPRRIEDSFQRRSASLPAQTQRLLLLAAAEPTGDVALLWSAAAQLSIAGDAAEPAAVAGLLEIDTRVRFPHPLARSAVYRAATPPDQRIAHGALATATDPQVDPDRRAWHRAQSVLGTDEEVAAELERSAGRARARGGSAAAAAFLQRAVELTPEPDRRATRALDAAQAKHEAGASEAATELLAVAAVGPLDTLHHARLQLLRAQVAFHTRRGSDAPGMLLDAATTLAPLNPALSRETYLHALDAATILGRFGPDRSVLEMAEAAALAPPPPGTPRPADLLLDGLVVRFTKGYAPSVPTLQRALEMLRDDDSSADGSSRWLWLASRIATTVWDDEMGYLLAARNVRLTRESGALATLPSALTVLSMTLAFAGKFAQATELAAESEVIMRVTGARQLRFAQLMLAAWRGREEETGDLHAASVRETTGGKPGNEVAFAEYALAVLGNGLGDYPAAYQAAARAYEVHDTTHSNLVLPELVEAASRAGQAEAAAAALEQLTSRASASGTSWALGLAARSRALTSSGLDAEEHYREALDHLGRCRIATHLARTHLVYGEWLRREGRRQDAREQLRTAHQMLADMGADAFAERAARELRATGEHPRSRAAQPTDALTAQELHIARIVATGATSREVGAQLFLSPRTIEAHLRSIFRKLGLTSRRQLRDLALP